MLNFLENKILKLRAPELSDAELLYIWENDVSIWRISNTITPFSKYILTKYIETSHHDIYQTKQLRLMIDLKKNRTGTDKETVGTIDLFDFDPHHNRAGVGILIRDDQRNMGYASEALDLIIKYTFNILNLHQLYCNITIANTASLKLFKKFGFDIIGEKKDWIKTSQGWEGEYILQLIRTS